MSGLGEHILEQPLDGLNVLRRKRAIRRMLRARDASRRPLRVAILAGSTSGEIREMLELFLLDAGFDPSFYESDYDRAFEDVLFDHERLDEFGPELVYVHTTCRNLRGYPGVDASDEDVAAALDEEAARYHELWERITVRYGCPIVQNNFEMPAVRTLGNLDAVDVHGRTSYTLEMNRRFAAAAREIAALHIHDIHYLSARFGLDRWHDETLWCLAKYAMCQEAIPHLAHGIARIVRSIHGRASKCLVLDLDNTLWGGIIGEDGPDGIRLGADNPEGESFVAFQTYVRELRRRGIILAVCSKNDEEIALEGIDHPDSVLKREDFAAFVANWEPKPGNVRAIAEMLEIGSDSLVFVDDNPMERAAVRAQAPEVDVPEVEANPLSYVRLLDRNGYFEPASFSRDDLSRSEYYRKNAQRKQHAGRFESYEDFLASLEMEAEIAPFSPVYLPRITQLINKTNQFNLTTQRMGAAEVEALARSSQTITLYGRLSDRFGDNGLIGVLIATVIDATATIDTWLMSCRVLRRGFEEAMLDRLVETARRRGVKRLVGRYIPTRKNGMVRDLYPRLGFDALDEDDDGTTRWSLDLAGEYTRKNRWIKVNDEQRQSA